MSRFVKSLWAKLLQFLLLISICPIANAQSQPKRPIVIVPGILGSKLCNGSEVVWGNVSSLRNFARLDLIGPEGEALKPCGILDEIAVLGPFWKIDAYRGLIETLHSLGFLETGDHPNMYIFAYDWRRSNIDNATLLSDFIAKISAPKVDIVAHSLGGLLSTIYAQNSAETHRINKIVYLGTPFMGAMNSFATLSEGWGGFKNLIAGGIDSIRRTVLSFPAIYELLPAYANCCRIGTRFNYTPADQMDPAKWRQLHWLPSEYDSGPRADYFDRQLKRAKDVQDIMRRPLPADIQSIKFVSDTFATDLYLVAPQSDPSWHNWTFVKDRGDETVPAWSAANNINSLEGTDPSFNVHGTIFNDPTVKNVLERELMEISMPREVRLRALSTASDPLRPFDFISISLEPQAAPIGQRSTILFSVQWEEATARGEFSPHATLKGPGNSTELQFTEITSDNDVAEKKSTFISDIEAPSKPGQWRIEFDLNGLGSGYVAVLNTYIP
jgi:pimeloyl-ACP methyl ester carboxylesterase